MKARRQLADLEETKKAYSVELRGGSDMNHWIVPLTIPRDSLYAGYSMRLGILFPDNYPFGCPILKFEHPVYHPQVNGGTYEVCQGVYKQQWRAASTPVSRMS